MIEYAVIKTQKGILTYYTGNGWDRRYHKAQLFPNKKAAEKAVISRLKDFGIKTFINGRPAT